MAREAAQIYEARLRLRPGELAVRGGVWTELKSRGATVATVPLWGKAGVGGATAEGGGHVEVEQWSQGFRDELCSAFEALVWARFASYIGQPQIAGEVVWLAEERVVELSAMRAGRRLEERPR